MNKTKNTVERSRFENIKLYTSRYLLHDVILYDVNSRSYLATAKSRVKIFLPLRSQVSIRFYFRTLSAIGLSFFRNYLTYNFAEFFLFQIFTLRIVG